MDIIKLTNSVSTDYNVLRMWLIPSVVEILANNKHHEYPQKVFTVGRIFLKDENKETKIKEMDCVAGAIASESADYTGIRQVVDYLLNNLGVDYKVEETTFNSFIKGRIAKIKANGKDVAYVGELNPSVLNNWELEVPVAVFGMNLDILYGVIKK